MLAVTQISCCRGPKSESSTFHSTVHQTMAIIRSDNKDDVMKKPDSSPPLTFSTESVEFTDRPKCEHPLEYPIQVCIAYFNRLQFGKPITKPSSGPSLQVNHFKPRSSRCLTTILAFAPRCPTFRIGGDHEHTGQRLDHKDNGS